MSSSSSACVIGHIAVKDPEKWAEYCRRVPGTLEPWRAELVFRGKQVDAFSGSHAYTDTVVLRFPDAESARAWHASDAYQALIPLRRQAADVLLMGYTA